MSEVETQQVGGVAEDAFDALRTVGHTDAQAREMIESILATGRTFGSVSEMVEAIYAGSPPVAEAEPDLGERPEVVPAGGEGPDDGAESEPVGEGPPEEELAADLTSIAVEEAIQKMFEVQDRLDSAIEDATEKSEVAKIAKKRVESLQDDLSWAVRRVRDMRNLAEPDPARFPLFDRPADPAKTAINDLFAKPEAIQPLPADTYDEFIRRKQCRTRIDSLGLSPKIAGVLADAGIETLDAWWRKCEALVEAGASLTTIKGLTASRLAKLSEAEDAIEDAWIAEWNAAHPDDIRRTQDEIDVEVAEARLADEGDLAEPFEEAVAGLRLAETGAGQ
jgi:hypothetical protein